MKTQTIQTKKRSATAVIYCALSYWDLIKEQSLYVKASEFFMRKLCVRIPIDQFINSH